MSIVNRSVRLLGAELSAQKLRDHSVSFADLGKPITKGKASSSWSHSSNPIDAMRKLMFAMQVIVTEAGWAEVEAAVQAVPALSVPIVAAASVPEADDTNVDLQPAIINAGASTADDMVPHAVPDEPHCDAVVAHVPNELHESILKAATRREAKLKAKNGFLQQRLKMARQGITRLDKRLKAERVKNKMLKQQIADANFKRGPKNRYFSMQGGMMLAARKIISRTGSEGVGLLLGIDTTALTTRVWQVKLRAALVASFRKWSARRYDILDKDSGREGLRVVFQKVRADATNWLVRGKKVHVTEVECMFVVRPLLEKDTWQTFSKLIDSRRIIGDLQYVKGGVVVWLYYQLVQNRFNQSA